MRILRSFGFLLCAMVALYVPLASAHTAMATITCNSVTFNYALFFTGSVTGGTSQETVKVDGTVVAQKTFTFPGATAQDVISITLNPASFPHTVEAITTFTGTDGFQGGSDDTQTLTAADCPCGSGAPDTADANASGSAYGIGATGLLSAPQQPVANSSQHGLGVDSHNAKFNSLSVPGVATITLLPVDSTSTVSTMPTQATNETVAETAGVNLLGGVITADTVRADTQAIAAGDHSGFSDSASTFANLVIGGVKYGDVPPNTMVRLPTLGTGAYVILHETFGATTRPVPGQTSGGTYAADVTVNMIHVHLPAIAIIPATDIIVSHAQAHASFPQTAVCAAAANQAVSGHAFVVAANLAGLAQFVEGYAAIPATGGSDTTSAASVTIPQNLGTLTGASASSQGGFTTTDSTSSSNAYIGQVNLLNNLIKATVVRSQSNSYAAAGGASSTPAGTQLLNITIGTTSIPNNPAPNTTIALPGIGFIVFNEQIPDAPAAGHNGLTVRAIRVHIDQLGGVIPGTEIIVAEAHSDAQFSPP